MLREAGWILLLGIGCWLALVLASYHRGDPGPFFSGTGDLVANKGGVAGAWIAETLLYLFGLSAWWWVALSAIGIQRLYRRVEEWDLLNRHTLAVALVGFALLLAASSTLEAMRLHSLAAELPQAPGGVLGRVLATFTAAAFSLFTGLSWLRFSELVGAGLEWAWGAVRARLEERRDREEGKIAALERGEKVEEAK